ncbi:MAG: glycosyltransferase family 4 protein [Eubacteriales bacterium]|nr:glycosyltransferase family 4 protein [Eubacteriales bacterium]
MPYQAIIYDKLSDAGYNVFVFYNDKKQTPYIPPYKENIYYFKNSKYDTVQMVKKIEEINPLILVVCGWSSRKYLQVARHFKRNFKIPVVCAIDTQFLNKVKQYIGFLVSPFYLKTSFTHIWVPGVRQYEFARRLHYDNSHIILNSLSGNVDLFNFASIKNKKYEYPKCLLYVGRYNKVKGIDILLQAWDNILDKKGWTLKLVGNGPLKEKLLGHEFVEVLDFMEQKELTKLTENCGVFILPSIYEPWALVLQEFAAAGLPIVCSEACGASPHFVINGYNGYIFKTQNVDDLKSKIEKIMLLSDRTLYQMAERSRSLSNWVTPEKSVASLLSVIE